MKHPGILVRLQANWWFGPEIPGLHRVESFGGQGEPVGGSFGQAVLSRLSQVDFPLPAVVAIRAR